MLRQHLEHFIDNAVHGAVLYRVSTLKRNLFLMLNKVKQGLQKPLIVHIENARSGLGAMGFHSYLTT